jgi:transcriptional regulator with XRE-family HTH domain
MRKGEGEPWDPDDFRAYVLKTAAVNGLATRADIARAAGISDGMLSKWLNGRQQPSPDSVRGLADAIRAPRSRLMILAGRATEDEYDGRADTSDAPTLEPLALELDQMLRGTSPLTAEQRRTLSVVVDHAMDAYRRHMRRRKLSAS